MADRLSEESILSTLDAGHSSLSMIQEEEVSGILAGFDLSRITDDPAVAQIIPAIPPQSLYISLVRQGPADNLAVLPYLSADQVVRLFDYDVWFDDKPQFDRALRWLSLFREIGPEELYRRYRELDEEYQIALLYGKVRTFTDEQLDQLDEALKDELHAMPCHTVFYQILSSDQAEVECINALIDAALQEDIGYAYMLLAHSENALSGEVEQLLTQFRTARLEEDGFVSYNESLAIFARVNLPEVLNKYRLAPSRAKAEAATTALVKSSTARHEPFLSYLLRLAGDQGWSVDERYQVQQSLLYLVNGLCAAGRIKPDDLNGMERLMKQAQALVSLGLEFLSGGDADLGLVILRQETAKDLFGAGLGLIDFARDKVLKRLAEAGLVGCETLQKLQAQRKWGLILHIMNTSVREVLGFEITAILKGLFNRFPVMPVLTGGTGDLQTPTFTVIDSPAALARFFALLDGISGLIYLTQTYAERSLAEPIERTLATSFVLAALGKPSAARELNAEELEAFSDLSDDELAVQAEDFWISLHDLLTRDFCAWSVSSGYAAPGDAIDHVISLYRQIVQGLPSARACAGALKPLVLSLS